MTTTDTVRVEIIAAVGQAISGLEQVAGKVLAGAVAWQTYKKLIVESVKEYMNAEKAAVSLANAFRIQKQYSDKTMGALQDMAAKLQMLTIYEDDTTVSAMAMLKQLTTLDAEAIMKLIPHIQDFASGMGLDLVQAATLVAKTIGSDTNALSRYGIEVVKGQTESEKLKSVIGELDSKFGGLAETVGNTAFGSMEKMKNQISDVKEGIGGVIVQVAQTSLSTWGLAWRNFWDVVLLRGSGPGTAAYDYILKLKGAQAATPGSGTSTRVGSQDMKQEIMTFSLDYVKALDEINRRGKTDIELKDEQIAQLVEMRRQLQLVEDVNKDVNAQNSEQLLVQQAINQLVKERKVLQDKYDESIKKSNIPQGIFGGFNPSNIPGPDQSSLVDWGPDSVVMLEAMAEAMHGLGKNAVKAKTEIDTFLDGLRNAAMGEAVNAMKALGEAWGSGKAVDAGAIIYDMAEAILAQMAALALGAAAACAIRFDWVGMWIWFGIAGVSALAGGYMAGAQARPAGTGGTQNLGTAQTYIPDAGTTLGNMVASRSVTVHVHGSVWSGEDLGQQLSRAMARA